MTHISLWNSPEFAGLRDGVVERLLVVDHRDDQGRLVGTLSGVVDDSWWVSGYSAPYGGFDAARPGASVTDVCGMVERCCEVARREALHGIRVRMRPPHSSPWGANLDFALFQQGFRVTESDLNFYIDLRSVSSGDEWSTSLRRESRRALRQVASLGLDVFTLAETDEAGWVEAYDVLRNNRLDKGRPMRLDLDYVRAARDRFSPGVRMLAIRESGRIIAAALVYRVGPGEDVVQYWGDHGHQLARSPMPLLVEAVVEDSAASGAEFLDIGISTDHGEPNLGLIQFKKAMGCSTELRVVMELEL